MLATIMARHAAHAIGFTLFFLGLSWAQGASAGPPTDQLRDGVDRVLKILRDPELRGDQHLTRRRTAIDTLTGEMFDFADMAKQSLGQHWNVRTPSEREEFVRLYTDLIQRSYVSKVDQHDAAEKMSYLGETVEGDVAVVQTTVPLTQGTLPLDYRMHNTDGRWRVYDISIDGLSLVANYRAQFNKVIRSESYEALVAKFKSRRTALPGTSAAIPPQAPTR